MTEYDTIFAVARLIVWCGATSHIKINMKTELFQEIEGFAGAASAGDNHRKKFVEKWAQNSLTTEKSGLKLLSKVKTP